MLQNECNDISKQLKVKNLLSVDLQERNTKRYVQAEESGPRQVLGNLERPK
jgi:hypothetical protein